MKPLELTPETDFVSWLKGLSAKPEGKFQPDKWWKNGKAYDSFEEAAGIDTPSDTCLELEK